MIHSTDITYDQLKEMKLKNKQEKSRLYHSNYYHTKTKNKIVYCDVCKKHLLKNSLKYHLNKSKEHQKNISNINDRHLDS